MELSAEYFHHPYSPYDIQLDFMRSLYTSLEENKVAIFESPTGTGKSLSLICGSLTWLRDHKRKSLQEVVNNATCDDNEPEWMKQFAKREASRAITEKRKEFELRLMRIRREEEKQRGTLEHPERPRKKQKVGGVSMGSDAQDDDHFVLDDYESESEGTTHAKGSAPSNELSLSTIQLLERLAGNNTAISITDEEEDVDDIKIFYCSRTHSQISQFASELRRVTIPSSIPEGLNIDLTEEELGERLKHISLGSRKNLCINNRVAELGNPTAINERCLDLQQPNTAAEKKCPFLPSSEDESKVSLFRDHALATVKDIEDLGKLGKKIGVCPYYASRSVIKNSEIITLPYPLLLQRSAREALDLSVKNHVVIIDEAHNLMDAIAGIHSVTVSLSQLQTSLFQLTTYARKFKTRLKGKNRSYIAQVIRLVSSIADNLQSIVKEKQALEGPVSASDLMSGKGVDQINPYKLSRYLQESKLARKVDGYVEFSKERAEKQTVKTTVPVLFHIQSFLLPLMNLSAEGRLFYVKNQEDIQLNYMLLDPTHHFREIVEDARAVILAGGTMSPMSDYTNHLFSYLPSGRLKTFSYGHVIPPENLTVHTLARGVLGTDFDFTYAGRDSEKTINDLGRTLLRLCRVIPDGVVAFFPSYDYLSQVLNIWKRPTGGEESPSLYQQIEKEKPILYESRDMKTTTDELLKQYAGIIEGGKGAFLLSVVGGKLSEGINFSDQLGRGVFIVGLPFPNIRSPVWQAKIEYIEQKAYRKQTSGTEESRRSVAKAAGRDFYENSCMRAVNQCIGRAIRHRNDYAAIVLMDRRYERPGIQGKLPGWIRQSMGSNSHLPAEPAVESLSKFFSLSGRGKKNDRALSH